MNLSFTRVSLGLYTWDIKDCRESSPCPVAAPVCTYSTPRCPERLRFSLPAPASLESFAQHCQLRGVKYVPADLLERADYAELVSPRFDVCSRVYTIYLSLPFAHPCATAPVNPCPTEKRMKRGIFDGHTKNTQHSSFLQYWLQKLPINVLFLLVAAGLCFMYSSTFIKNRAIDHLFYT